MDNNNMNQPQGDQYQNAYQQPMDQYQNAYQQPMDQAQNAYQQPTAYQQPVYQNVYQTSNDYEEPVSVGNWMLSMLVLAIPCVNVIMMFVWAFSGSTPKSKSNFFKAYLIWFAIAFVLYLLFFLLIGGLAGMSEFLSDL